MSKSLIGNGPFVSCWNVNGGWNLNQQVEWLKAGRPYFPTVGVPLLVQGANKPKAIEEWFPKYGEALKYLNEKRLPVAFRWHNWLSDFTEPKSEFRKGAFEQRPTVYRIVAGGLDDGQLVDPFGPVEPWRLLGEQTMSSLWMQRLKAALPNCPSVYAIENNEGPADDLRKATKFIIGKDGAWLPNLETVSVRAAEFAKTHSPDEAAKEIEKRVRIFYGALTESLKKNSPWPLTTGAFAGKPELYDAPSYRIYADGGEFPAELPSKPFEISVWFPPGRAQEKGVTPAKLKDLVADLIATCQPTIVRWYSGSANQLDTPWIDPAKESVKPEFKDYTEGDYFAAVMSAVEEARKGGGNGGGNGGGGGGNSNDARSKLIQAKGLIDEALEAIEK